MTCGLLARPVVGTSRSPGAFVHVLNYRRLNGEWGPRRRLEISIEWHRTKTGFRSAWSAGAYTLFGDEAEPGEPGQES